ncbi:MAG TPA: hypothetical protein VF816_14185 [Rhodocyclaceae bacterium]
MAVSLNEGCSAGSNRHADEQAPRAARTARRVRKISRRQEGNIYLAVKFLHGPTVILDIGGASSENGR